MVVYRYIVHRLCQNGNSILYLRRHSRFCSHWRTTNFTATELCAKLKSKQTVAFGLAQERSTVQFKRLSKSGSSKKWIGARNRLAAPNGAVIIV